MSNPFADLIEQGIVPNRVEIEVLTGGSVRWNVFADRRRIHTATTRGDDVMHLLQSTAILVAGAAMHAEELATTQQENCHGETAQGTTDYIRRPGRRHHS